jgi:cytochrome c-type biogenesis protein CcmH/NrfG
MSAVPVQPAVPAPDPSPPGAWLARAEMLHARGDVAGADRAFAQHLREAARDPNLMRAALAMGENLIPEAEALLRAHLQRQPNDIAALRMLAEVAARIARDEDAVRLLARCSNSPPASSPRASNTP